MCALQECGGTPLLAFREAQIPHFQHSTLDSPNAAMAGYVDSRLKNHQMEEELKRDEDQSSEVLNSSNFVNVPSGFEEKQHFKSKKIFQIPDMYSVYDPTPAEVDQLLPVKMEKVRFMKEAENLSDQSSRKPFTQRSVSDYYLSKRYEDVKFVPVSDMTPVKPELVCGYSPEVEPSDAYPKEDRNLEFCVPNSSNCFHPPSEMFVETDPEPIERRTSFQIECEPGTSGFGQDMPDDITAAFEDKNFYKTYNLNPTVNMKIFDTESLSESGDVGNSSGVTAEASTHRVSDDAWFMPSSRHTFSGAELSGSASAAQLSIASSFGDSNTPTCKICHMPAKADDPLISPCRCTGTLHYIHCGCLMRWLEICNKRSRKPPACELCKYQFHWHKKFKVRHWQFPHCSWRDKILHTVFLISVLVMIGCAIVTVMCFRQHRGNKADIAHLELSQSEIITLICGALFFLAFFLAMYVEIKARNTIYKLLVKFIYLNQQWYIDEYDKKGENTVIDV